MTSKFHNTALAIFICAAVVIGVQRQLSSKTSAVIIPAEQEPIRKIPTDGHYYIEFNGNITNNKLPMAILTF